VLIDGIERGIRKIS